MDSRTWTEGETLGKRSVALRLTSSVVVRPIATLAVAVVLLLLLLWQAAGVVKEVGYAGYFGPHDRRVEQLSAFLDEFQSGIHLLVVFGCGEGAACDRVYDEPTLAFLGRLHAAIDELPNVRRTWSLLNSPIVVGPLEAVSLGRKDRGSWHLRDDWEELVSHIPEQGFLVGSVISPDARTAGLVIELQSIQSQPMQAVVHGLQDLLPAFEEELGAEIYLAGDPVWTVLSSDSLSRDSNRLTVLMIVMMLGVLWLVFRDLALSILPVLAVGGLVGAVQGVQGLLGIPMTSILAALPPVLVVIAVTASIHLLTAFQRRAGDGVPQALEHAAGEVGTACFWAAATTAAGLGSFLWSTLQSFRHFGLLAAVGLGMAFVLNFTVLPALLVLRSRLGGWSPAERATAFAPQLLAAARAGVSRRPRFVMWTVLLTLLMLSIGATRLFYATDVGFGEKSFIIRSLRFIEANFRQPMTTEVAITIPAGRRIYSRESLQLIARVEEIFEREPSTGRVWSFLDLLEEAYRIDHGRDAATFDDLVAAAPRSMAIVASLERSPAYWSESTHEEADGTISQRDRARVSVDRAWLDDTVQGPYIARIRDAIDGLDREVASDGYRVELEGGLILAQRFLELLRDTQWKSFASAFLVVAATLVLLLWGRPRLILWAVVANVLPIGGLVGLMGWARIGVDPANMMVGALLLSIAVDDTIHVALRYKRARDAGSPIRVGVEKSWDSVGEAVVVSSICLSLGFSVLALSEWGGLVSFGLLASLGVLFALVGDLLLLPAALLSRAEGEGA